MKWIKFKKPSQTELFLKGIISLYLSIYSKLEKEEKPFFSNYWLKELNYSHCYILTEDDTIIAFASYPKSKDRHYERWQVNHLSISPDFKKSIIFPKEFNKKEYFLTPVLNNSCKPSFSIEKSTITVTQINYVKHLKRSQKKISHNKIKFLELNDNMIKEARELVTPENTKGNLPEIYIPVIKREIENSLTYNSSWCYCGKKEDTGEIIAFALYTGVDLPMTGIPCALTGYVIVRPDMRGKGIAAKLQKFAYRKFIKKGITWTSGNVAPDNIPSIKQIMKLKRKPWAMTVRITKEKD